MTDVRSFNNVEILQDIEEDVIIIRDSDANHISNVLRLNAGDEIEVCDGDSTDYICKIESISKSLI